MLKTGLIFSVPAGVSPCFIWCYWPFMFKMKAQVVTLANSIVGVSVLAMPFCFKFCGIFLATLMLVLSAILTRILCHFLIKAGTMSKRRTFEMLGSNEISHILSSFWRLFTNYPYYSSLPYVRTWRKIHGRDYDYWILGRDSDCLPSRDWRLRTSDSCWILEHREQPRIENHCDDRQGLFTRTHF